MVHTDYRMMWIFKHELGMCRLKASDKVGKGTEYMSPMSRPRKCTINIHVYNTHLVSKVYYEKI